MPLRQVWSLVCFTAVLSITLAGCTKRQLVPGIIAGAGAAMVTSGAAYRASLDTDRMETPPMPDSRKASRESQWREDSSSERKTETKLSSWTGTC